MFNILNEGSKKLILVVGDSHAHVIVNRFLELYKQKK
jgi:hypothetical protein